jgi:hypothetical protein
MQLFVNDTYIGDLYGEKMMGGFREENLFDRHLNFDFIAGTVLTSKENCRDFFEK